MYTNSHSTPYPENQEYVKLSLGEAFETGTRQF